MFTFTARIAIFAFVGLTFATPVQAQSMTPAVGKKEPSAALMAARERQKTCSAEWKAGKASGTLPKDAKWPKFWSACNTRLKGKSA